MTVQYHFEPEPGAASAMPQISPPKPLVRAALVVVALTFTLAIAASQFGIGKSADVYTDPVAQRALTFHDAPDGGIIINDAHDGSLALALPSGTNGFIRGSLRALAQTRRQSGYSDDAAFVLTAWGDGRLSLEDPLTGERIAISSFGPTQVKSFVALLDPAKKVFQ